jgi:hypothetical protein
MDKRIGSEIGCFYCDARLRPLYGFCSFQRPAVIAEDLSMVLAIDGRDSVDVPSCAFLFYAPGSGADDIKFSGVPTRLTFCCMTS